MSKPDLKVLKIYPGGKKEIKMTYSDPYALPNEVEGYITMPTFKNNKYVVILDKEARLNNKPFNLNLEGIACYGIVLICRAGVDWCESIQDEDIQELFPGSEIKRNLMGGGVYVV